MRGRPRNSIYPGQDLLMRSLRLATCFPRHGRSSSRLLSMPRLLLLYVITAATAGCGGSGEAAPPADAELEVPLYRQPLTGAALEHFELGEAADRSADYGVAAEEYAQAIRLAPHNLAAYEAYEWARRRVYVHNEGVEGSKLLQAMDGEYASMMQSNPENAIVPYLLGKLWFYGDREKSREMLLTSTRIDPDFAPAWSYLGLHAEGQGDKEQVREYERRAAEADPSNPQYYAHLAYSYGLGTGSNWAEFRSRGEAFVERYPGVERTAQMLSWLGSQAPTADLSVRYFRQSIDAHPIEEGEEGRNRWVESAYGGLYQVLQETDPDAAATLARDAVRAGFAGQRQWPSVYQRQTLLNLSRTLRQAGDTDDALEYLTKAREQAGGWVATELDRAILVELALVAEASGDVARSRELLLDVLAENADVTAGTELARIMAAEGASEADVQEAIWERRLAAAKPAAGLGLLDLEGRTVELEDFAGEVVLLNFWYPACGPCRVEFPYLAAVVEKFADRGLVTLAANVHPAEAAEVAPFMENTGYPFRALQTDWEWAEEKYGVRGAPTNFIIDPEGRIIHDPGIINSARSQAEFERWLQSLYDYLALKQKAESIGTDIEPGSEG
jgi:tetratricopeptide (TPR) repeat protein